MFGHVTGFPRVLKLCISAMSLPGKILPELSNRLNFASQWDIFGFCLNTPAPKLKTNTLK